MARVRRLRDDGIIRQIGPIFDTKSLGYASSLVAMKVAPEERVDECGTLIASFSAVSHCYRRPSYPDWPYSIFSMVHGRSREECESVLDAISKETGLTEYIALYSSREHKKVRIRYDDPAFEEWEARFGTPA